LITKTTYPYKDVEIEVTVVTDEKLRSVALFDFTVDGEDYKRRTIEDAKAAIDTLEARKES